MDISSSKEHVLSKIRVKKLQMLFYTETSFLKKPLVLGKVLASFTEKELKHVIQIWLDYHK